VWMPAAEDHAEHASCDGDEECADEQVSRNGENSTRFTNTAKIEDGDNNQNAQANRNGVRQQSRDR